MTPAQLVEVLTALIAAISCAILNTFAATYVPEIPQTRADGAAEVVTEIFRHCCNWITRAKLLL